jgi:hypothetical protein
MNTEIVRRLRDSFLTERDPTTVIAETLLHSLDGEVIDKMVEIAERERADDLMAEIAREDELMERERGEDSK